MKKYVVLTSILALAACGGGGGGGGTTAPIRAAVTEDAKISNNAITGMASEVLVAKDGTTAVRSAIPLTSRKGSVVQDGKTYTSYRLDDVKFRMAAGAVADDAYIKFHMDPNGRIDSLTANLQGLEQEMIRKADGENPSADFRGIVYEYVITDATEGATVEQLVQAKDKGTLVRLIYNPDEDITDYSVLSNAEAGKCPDGKVCRWDRIDQALRIASSGKSNNESQNMKYSDFGKMQTTNFGKYKGITSSEDLAESKEHQRTTSGGIIQQNAYKTWATVTDGDFDDDFQIFAGGYDILSKRPTETMTFTGKAIGSLYASDSQYHGDQGIALTDDAATLEFNTTTGKETLVMDFTGNAVPWYKVTVTKDNAAGTSQIKFDEYANTDTNHLIVDKGGAFDTGIEMKDYLKFHNDNGSGLTVDDFTTTTGTLVKNTEGTQNEGLLNMGYYGVDATEEAAGIVRFKETYQTDTNVQHEHEFRAGYGMKPDAH